MKFHGVTRNGSFKRCSNNYFQQVPRASRVTKSRRDHCACFACKKSHWGKQRKELLLLFFPASSSTAWKALLCLERWRENQSQARNPGAKPSGKICGVKQDACSPIPRCALVRKIRRGACRDGIHLLRTSTVHSEQLIRYQFKEIWVCRVLQGWNNDRTSAADQRQT